MNRSDSQEGSGATKQTGAVSTHAALRRSQHSASHVLTPLRTLTATAPSGVQIVFIKYADGAERELSWYQGNLSDRESAVFWSAKLKAERPGLDKWQEAIEVLERGGFALAAPGGRGEQ